MLHSLIYLVVSFLASVVGALCGIGGGVIIKPVLDLFSVASVATIRFLSGCTVLSMSCYSVGKNLISGNSSVDLKTGTPLAIGGVLGGVAGKEVFQALMALLPGTKAVGSIQSACLCIITLATLIFCVNKARITTYRFDSKPLCLLIGFGLGLISSFLGIGGGPINLVVLFFFFSMDTRTAAQNSLYVILFSQAASLITSLLTGRIPDFSVSALVFMICGGITGGMAGRHIGASLDSEALDKLFNAILLFIICISAYNVFRLKS